MKINASQQTAKMFARLRTSKTAPTKQNQRPFTQFFLRTHYRATWDTRGQGRLDGGRVNNSSYDINICCPVHQKLTAQQVTTWFPRRRNPGNGIRASREHGACWTCSLMMELKKEAEPAEGSGCLPPPGERCSKAVGQFTQIFSKNIVLQETLKPPLGLACMLCVCVCVQSYTHKVLQNISNGNVIDVTPSYPFHLKQQINGALYTGWLAKPREDGYALMSHFLR